MSERIANINDAVSFVESRLRYHDDIVRASRETGGSQHIEEHIRLVRRFGELRAQLVSVRDERIAKSRGAGLNLLPGDLQDLPDELLEELGLTESEQQELEILRLMEGVGGVASIDLLLVEWYRSSKTVMKRRVLTSRLYRMQQKGRIFPVSGVKGVYALKQQADVEHETQVVEPPSFEPE